MQIDNIDQQALNTESFDVGLKLKELGKSFESKLDLQKRYYENLSSNFDDNIAKWVNEGDAKLIAPIRASSAEIIQNMFSGTEINGNKTLSLSDINKWNINPDYEYANLKQHAGYSAEVISTAKENIVAQANDTGITTYRTDDLPEIYGKNNQYVDKVRVDANGKVVDRIQTKFVGKDSSECLSKLASSKYGKYLNDGQVDKIEIPKDYYDDIKNKLIPKKISKLEEQVKRSAELGKDDVVAKKTAEIEKYKKIDSMIEKSLVTNDEAINATKHPKIYAAKLFAKNAIGEGHETGVNAGLTSAGITLCVSTVDNVSKIFKGELEVDEGVANIVSEAGSSAIAGYGTGFVTGTVSALLKGSAHELIQKIGGSSLPGALVSFALQSYDVVTDYISGKIDEYKLAEGLGDSASKVGGGVAGAALGTKAGAAVCSVIPGAGTAAGGVIGGIIGGMVGCAVATETYQSTVELVKENLTGKTGAIATETAVESAEVVVKNTQEVAQNIMKEAEKLAAQAQECASDTINLVKYEMPDKLPDVKSAFSDFASKCNMSFNV